MPAPEPLGRLIGINTNRLSKEENFILEVSLFAHVCNEFEDMIKVQNKDYLRFIKSNKEKEVAMLNANLIRYVINDILLTGDYSVEGLAYYTETADEVIYDLASGKNVAPSMPLFRKIIDLHKSIRTNLYRDILSKAVTEAQVEA